MRRSALLITFLLLSLASPPGAHAITDGVPDAGHDYVGAFVGTVVDPATGQQQVAQFCTGTLVGADVVLTASHCFVGLEEFGITNPRFTLDEVVDEDLDGFVDGDVRLLTGTAHTHELFATGGTSNTYDIAVFRLSDPVSGVAPAQLPRELFLDDPAVRGHTFVAVGYGTGRVSHRQAGQAFVPTGRRMMAEQHLRSVTPAWANFSMNPATGDGGTCFGDSGGPHLHGDVVVSITVTGDAVCKASDKTYRVDTPWAREFLSRFVTVP